MKFVCPNCKAIYNGQLRYCPVCGTKIKYSEHDEETFNNVPDEVRGCGCFLIALFIFVIIFMII